MFDNLKCMTREGEPRKSFYTEEEALSHAYKLKIEHGYENYPYQCPPSAITGTFAPKTGKSKSFPTAVVPTATANRKLYTQRRKTRKKSDSSGRRRITVSDWKFMSVRMAADII